jgi:hypothetical protein
VVNLIIEDGTAKQRRDDLRQEKVRNGFELISRGGVAGDIHAQAAQLLNQPSDFGAIRGNFLRDLGAAYNHRCVFHQQAYDAAETNVGGLGAGFGSFRGRACPEQSRRVARCRTSCFGFLNDGIMRYSAREQQISE